MKISKKDWAQLSAYLDGELSPRDLRKIEGRIQSDPDFQAALEDLKEVKAILSHTPKLAVPRDFTLEPSLVQQKPRQARNPLPVYRLAAAALSVLFVTVVVLDLGSVVLKGDLSASQAPLAEEVMLEAAAEAVEEPEMMAVEEAEADSISGGPGSGGANQTPEMEEAPLASEYDGQSEEGEAIEMMNPETKDPAEDEERAVDEAEDAIGEETEDQIAEDEVFVPEEELLPPAEELPRRDEPIRIPWLRILEILFGLGAVGFGIAAWRRRS